MVPTYQSSRWLGETLESVLRQDPGASAMQIEVVDDASGDDPAAVVAAVAGNRVAFSRQPENRGHVATFNECLRRARGRLVHLLHGDDQVRPGFYLSMARAFELRPDAGAAFCRQVHQDGDGRVHGLSPLERAESGVLEGWLETIAEGQRLQAVAMVVRRDVYERLGGFDRRIHAYGEDWEMWVRIAAHYPFWYEPEPLAVYRFHARSLSAGVLRTGRNVRDLSRVIDLNRALLPSGRAAAITRRARSACARAALRRGRRMLKANDFRGPLAQAREAVRCRPTPDVVARAAILVGHWAARGLRLALARRTVSVSPDSRTAGG
jgi:GT2 family glycosyltransferase